VISGSGVSLLKKSSSVRRTGRLAQSFTSGFADIVDRYKYSVVNIEVLQPASRTTSPSRPESPWDLFFPRRTPSDSPQSINIGTGFVFHKDGYILTNEHVVHGVKEVMIRLYHVKKPIVAKVVATNYDLDLAILKAKLPKRTVILPFGRSKDVRVGEWVLAIGNPITTISQSRVLTGFVVG
jgi:S1-C subfamily serine protease